MLVKLEGRQRSRKFSQPSDSDGDGYRIRPESACRSQSRLRRGMSDGRSCRSLFVSNPSVWDPKAVRTRACAYLLLSIRGYLLRCGWVRKTAILPSYVCVGPRVMLHNGTYVISHECPGIPVLILPSLQWGCGHDGRRSPTCWKLERRDTREGSFRNTTRACTVQSSRKPDVPEN